MILVLCLKNQVVFAFRLLVFHVRFDLAVLLVFLH
jgi:hypothetical protein